MGSDVRVPDRQIAEFVTEGFDGGAVRNADVDAFPDYRDISVSVGLESNRGQCR